MVHKVPIHPIAWEGLAVISRPQFPLLLTLTCMSMWEGQGVLRMEDTTVAVVVAQSTVKEEEEVEARISELVLGISTAE